ncbi:MAG TPA: hypothetical protein VMW62_15860 [Chloroflexota bacterium]|nr:hypothetical protein [Chloroflexota bacterium]
MKYPTTYATPDGESHFGEAEMAESPTMDAQTPLTGVKGVFVRRTAANWSVDRHTAPRRQLVIPLQGTMEIQTSDGQVRQFGPGAMFLAGDTSGRGHTTRSVGSEERVTLFVVLEDEA